MKLTGDEIKWAESSSYDLKVIAHNWAKKYNHKQLRAFQSQYADIKDRLPCNTDLNVKKRESYQNMWQVATWAISIEAFGVI